MLEKQATAFCAQKGMKPYRKNRKHGNYRKVYDMFLLAGELDWLEIRLHTLASYVDYFVIAESPKTFTGLDKPLHLRENWNRFTKFHTQIIYRIVPDPGASVGPRVWDHEDYMRNALFDQVFPALMGTEEAPRIGDALVVSDIDEVPRPDTMLTLRNCDFPRRLTLRSHFYYYSFQWKHVGDQWAHPQATTFHGLRDTIKPVNLRNGDGGHGLLPIWPLQREWEKAELADAGWHCSSCFATIKQMVSKMESFSHQSLNTAENRDPKNITERVRNGLDLFGRVGENYIRTDNNNDIPKYILDNREEFGYMLNRDGRNAGFLDANEFVELER
ncbi:glycosyltransferase family 17 protein [Polychaeton citri CBS 116435]|uniref:Glycosyltransferase family 17 protein n=1 Tax=Polychaeton citri CBS 116435 TaxID=1314669 RepID=A0A9P4PW23_9PEZI|nr:glycosyltransferase family 17 protein [Polychaeton citri CBS 116435]